jgi:hypothetical protein
LYAREGVKVESEQKDFGSAAPSMRMNLTVETATPQEIQIFTDALHEVLPLAEVKTIEYNTDQAEYEIAFYYDTVNSAALAKQVDISALSPSERELLQQMTSWSQQIAVPTTEPQVTAIPTPVVTSAPNPSP